MDKKLAEYRKRKEREAYIQQAKIKMWSILPGIFKRNEEKLKDLPSDVIREETETLIDSEAESSDIIEDFEDEEKKCTVVDYLNYLLWFAFWVILYVIFIQLGFGLVFLILSGLVGMYLNTRTTPRKPHEASAYSVFNKNCESIDGTLKAEHLEREMLYGPMAHS